MHNNQINLPFIKCKDFIIILYLRKNSKEATIAHLKKTITIGEISPGDNLPAIVFPAHPNIQRDNNRIELSIVSFLKICIILKYIKKIKF